MADNKRDIIAIGSEIGRGHPQYLDSVLYYLKDVPRFSASGLGWSLGRFFYRMGGKGGFFTCFYNLSRARRRPGKLELFLLKGGFVRRIADHKGVVLVDHPLLAHLLSPQFQVAYLHGEIAAPPIAAVVNAWRIFVPIEKTAKCLLKAGVRQEALLVTGLVIEPELIPVAETSFLSRLKRFQSKEPLNVAFFTSGAYPKPHLKAIALAASSARQVGHNVIIFAGVDRRRARFLPQALTFNSRQEENQKTSELFSQIDLFVAAAHERTNWAVGLGLPMFALLPHIGPFAKENFEFALNQGVCLPLTRAEEFGSTLSALRQNGKLREMAYAGWQKHPITGAQVIANFLLSCEATQEG
ncbi:MAG: hypothetical protein ABIK18_01965 [candidate division WOR-3 bacterium]